jgi:prepilin-type processing-associated H-X9-DG protein
MSCTNNVKQIALATHNYHDTHNELPSGSTRPDNPGGYEYHEAPGAMWAPLAVLTPFIEMNATYDQVRQAMVTGWEHLGDHIDPMAATDTVYSPELGSWGPAYIGYYMYFPALAAEVPAFRCPSDPVRGPIPHWWWDYYECSHGVTNYRACTGDLSFGIWGGNLSWYVGIGNGERDYPRGAFWMTIEQGLDALADGTSNTIIWSERAVTPVAGNANGTLDRGLNSIVAYGHASFTAWSSWAGPLYSGGTPASASMLAEFTPGNCLATLRNSKEYYEGSVAPGNHHSASSWWMGMATSTLFTTIMPPNGPSCTTALPDSTLGMPAAVAPTSYHTGGVTVGFGDGSVRFVSDTIDSGPSNAKCVTVGPSPFGVWGALGSHNGGESASL